jgi:hypothetical protein
MAGKLISAAVSAVAFTGSGYLFKQFDKHGSLEEMKRHNLAQEQLQKASIKWGENRKQVIDFANLQLQKEHHAAVDFNNADDALTLYNHLNLVKRLQFLENHNCLPSITDAMVVTNWTKHLRHHTTGSFYCS